MVFDLVCPDMCVSIVDNPSSRIFTSSIGLFADLPALLHRCCFMIVGGDGMVVIRGFRVVSVKEEAERFLCLFGGDKGGRCRVMEVKRWCWWVVLRV